jgi:signal transduction histidine kinase
MDSTAIGRAEEVVATDVLRDVVHELRQPLSTIESLAFYLAMVLPPADERLRNQIAHIRQLVEQSNWILTSGLGLAWRDRHCTPVELDAEELITRAASASAASERMSVRLSLAGGLPHVKLDAAQGQELAEALLMLARQLAARGEVSLSSSSRREGGVELKVEAPGQVSLSGFGPGAMLGLENARRIAERHGGTLLLEALPETGIRLSVMLP